jgi:hypothetical protein
MAVRDLLRERMAINRPARAVPIRICRRAPAESMRHLIDGAGRWWDVPRVGPGAWAMQDGAIQLEQHDIVRPDGRPVETLAAPAARAACAGMPGPLVRGVGRTGV